MHYHECNAKPRQQLVVPISFPELNDCAYITILGVARTEMFGKFSKNRTLKFVTTPCRLEMCANGLQHSHSPIPIPVRLMNDIYH